jgi:hypothetical protein
LIRPAPPLWRVVISHRSRLRSAHGGKSGCVQGSKHNIDFGHHDSDAGIGQGPRQTSKTEVVMKKMVKQDIKKPEVKKPEAKKDFKEDVKHDPDAKHDPDTKKDAGAKKH